MSSCRDVTDAFTGAALYAFALIYFIFVIALVNCLLRTFIEAIVAADAVIVDIIGNLFFSALRSSDPADRVHKKRRRNRRGTGKHELPPV